MTEILNILHTYVLDLTLHGVLSNLILSYLIYNIYIDRTEI